jgi:GT2 family glycosyltransferase
VIREITAIYVSWNDAEDLFAAVASLAQAAGKVAAGGVRVSLVVVDNGGALDATSFERLWPGARFIVNHENRGFGPAANQGAAAAPGDVVLFLNPDTRVEGEPFSVLARAFDEFPRAVAVAPRLIDLGEGGPPPGPLRLAPPAEEDQATFQLRRLPTLASDARELLLIDHLWPNNPGRRFSRYADSDREKPFAIEQAAAAALAVRKDVFARIGGFDERFAPAWYEDVDLCDRLGREGEILYVPGARVGHRGGESASRLGYDRFLPLFYRNAMRYRSSRYGLLARAGYRVLLAAGMLLRLAALPLRGKVPRPRAQAARAYVRVLGAALWQ